ncbi:flavodoxin [Pasteurella multocida]|uniref:flavodoxin n=1 Tax=Pasteurella multocida TaxID=747 RepID=UPI0035F3EA99
MNPLKIALFSAALLTTSMVQAKSLIIYFSQPESYTAEQLVDGVSGASKLIKNGEMLGANEYLAKEIQKNTGAELFRLETVQSYPITHQPLLDFAQNEQRQNIKPALKSLPNLADVDTVFLVYPIWWYQMPMPLYSLLEQVDFSGKISCLWSDTAVVVWVERIKIFSNFNHKPT